jgi:hypothetical protein
MGIILDKQLVATQIIYITAQIWPDSSTCTEYSQSKSVNEPLNSCVPSQSGSIKFKISSIDAYSDTTCTTLIGIFPYGQCIDYGGDPVIYTTNGTSCVNFENDLQCELQHGYRSGPCLTITWNNKNVSATSDHLIRTSKGWKLFRELTSEDHLSNKKIHNIYYHDFCNKLSVCRSSNYTFMYEGIEFSTVSLITPEDLMRLPKWMKYINKLWINI